jgi:hypothetical protein
MAGDAECLAQLCFCREKATNRILAAGDVVVERLGDLHIEGQPRIVGRAS